MTESKYREEVRKQINKSKSKYGNEFILLVGAGFSKRYLNMPGWSDLLQKILTIIESPYPISYFEQINTDLISTAESISKEVHKWAWGKGRKKFQEHLFQPNVNYHLFMKILISQEIEKYSFDFLCSDKKEEFSPEIDLLKKTNVHTTITTNYDQFLEHIFNFSAIFGTDTLLHETSKKGYVLKPHGCCSTPESIVIFPYDYEKISLKHQYFFSKILTFFSEKNIMILGYSMSDPDIKEVLLNISKSLSKEILENVFYVEYEDEDENSSNEFFEINMDDRKAQLNLVKTREYDWVFKSMDDK